MEGGSGHAGSISWAAAAWALLALAAGVLFARAALPGIAPASDVWDYSQEARLARPFRVTRTRARLKGLPRLQEAQ